MTYSAAAIANYFVRKGVNSRRAVDPMKLQKLIYFAHGWNLAIHGEPLIDERVEAWSYGPVVPSIYHAVKGNGADPIDFPIFLGREVPQIGEGDSETRALLDRIWEVYGGYPSIELSRMSHEPEGPWNEIWNGEARRGTVKGVDIPDSLIQRYFIQAGKRNAA